MPATDSTTTLTPSMSAMLAALSADRGASVTELSGRAELGRSTSARVLTTLEGMGLAKRERPDRSADHSSPDLWFSAATNQTEPADSGDASEPDPQSSDVPPQPVDGPRSTPDSDPASAASSANTHDGEGADEPALPSHDEAEPDAVPDGEIPATQPEPGDHPNPAPVADPQPAVDGAATEAATGQETQAQSATVNGPEPDAHSAPASGTGAAETETADDDAPSKTGAMVRLGKGELRAMVVEHLRAHPDEEFTASQVGKALGKSSGAVSNNFDALVKTGEAEMTCEKPRRFRFLANAER